MRECVVCRGGQPHAHYAGLVRCDGCGHVWAPVELGGAEVSRLYDRGYFFGDEYTDYVGEREAMERNFGRRFSALERYLDPPRHRRLFEIGCAYGFFLNLVRSRFERVAGIDVSAAAVAWARDELGLDVTLGDLLAHDFGAARYDVACLWDTIEHLAEPDRYVQAISGRMDGGALLAITTGDIGSLNARLRRGRWRLIHPPSHLHYFSRAGLAHMLDRLGFDVVHTESCGVTRRLGSVLDGILRVRGGHARAGAWARRMPLANLPLYLNLYDIMYVIAIKRPG